MKQSRRITIGLWLEQFEILHPYLLKYNHDYGGKSHFVNRVSRTLVTKRSVLAQ